MHKLLSNRSSALSISTSLKRSFSYIIPKDMDTTEYLDSEPEIASKAIKLARTLTSAKRVVCFTGAGISTSPGIPDYRSGFYTILATGPGAWESEENKKKYTKESVRVETIRAIPSKTHMAISELVSRGLIDYVVTQNVDGLHRKSGVPENKLTELHGGTNKEVCKTCHTEHLRDFRVRDDRNPLIEHKTPRNCSNCGGNLYDTIVYFGQPLRVIDKEKANHEAELADLGLVLGTSLKVAPASRYPAKLVGHEGKKLAIVNLQKTHLDKKSALRIGGMCDTVVDLMMQKLGIIIPEFKVDRWLSFQVDHKHDESILKIKSYQKDGREFSAIKSAEVDLNADKSNDFVDLENEPFEYKFFGNLNHLKCRLKFYGNHGEPDLDIGGDDWGPLWEALRIGREIVVHAQYRLGENNWDLLEARGI